MRTLPIHLDRLAAALKLKGVTLKRNSLLEVAASAFGYHNQNQLAAAYKKGDLDPSPVHGVGLVNAAGRQMALLENEDGRAFAIEANLLSDDASTASFVINPYGGIVDLRRTGDLPDLSGSGRGLHFASITHEYGSNLYCDATEAGLQRQVADWCREYWEQEGVDGSFEGLSDEEVSQAYFDHADEDGVTYFDSDAVKIPASSDRPSRSTPFVPDQFDMRSAYIIGRTTGDAEEPILYWSNDDGWVDSQSATVLDGPLASWPAADVDAGSLFVVPLPNVPSTDVAARKPYLNRGGRGLDIEFLTNRECDVQGPEDRAAEAMPWIEADEIDVGLGPLRAAEIGYAALVDGKVYLAPTIKAFHFDADDSVQAMMENSQELQEYAVAIEPAIRAVGGMAMLEEDSEAVMLTILIPLSEAKCAPDFESWKAALGELLAPPGKGAGIVAQFVPQTAINDCCYDADPLGSDRIDVSYEVLLMGEEAAREMYDEDDDAEALKDAIRAPKWISEWQGPFSVRVRDAVAAYYGFDPDE